MREDISAQEYEQAGSRMRVREGLSAQEYEQAESRMNRGEGILPREYEQAESQLRAEERQDFYIHAIIFALVNIMLIIINLTATSGVIWFFYPLIGWGIGLMVHFLVAVVFVQTGSGEWQMKIERRAAILHRRQSGLS